KRDVESIVAAANPRPDVPSSVRRVSRSTTQTPVSAEPVAPLRHSPDAATNTEREDERQHVPRTAERATALLDLPDAAANAPREEDERQHVPRPAHASQLAPLSSEHYRVQFTISQATHDKLRRVQDLMRHTNPNGDPAVIFDRALTLLLAQL